MRTPKRKVIRVQSSPHSRASQMAFSGASDGEVQERTLSLCVGQARSSSSFLPRISLVCELFGFKCGKDCSPIWVWSLGQHTAARQESGDDQLDIRDSVMYKFTVEWFQSLPQDIELEVIACFRKLEQAYADQPFKRWSLCAGTGISTWCFGECRSSCVSQCDCDCSSSCVMRPFFGHVAVASLMTGLVL